VVKQLLLTAALICFQLLSAGTSLAKQERIVIGVIPEVNLVKQMDRYTPLCRYLGKKIGVPVEVKPLANYGRIYEKMRDGEIDGGFFGSFVYAMTRAKIEIEPIARPARSNGVSSYAGVTFVRKDSGINRAEDMKGRTIALVDPATTGGYLAQKEYLAHHGVDLDRDMKILWTGSHDEVVTAVMQERAEIGGAKNTAVDKYRKDNKYFDETLKIINVTPKEPRDWVPDNAFAVRKDMEDGLKKKIRKAFISMHTDKDGKAVLAKFGASRFVETSDADYRSVYELVKHLNIDLKNYPYKNR
jgi:phosphonate transport system substrate-binding protein